MTSFTDTRSRATDSETSRVAAKNAASKAASDRRKLIVQCITKEPLTAREVDRITGIGYVEVQRRISECGLVKTGERRDGCMVWSVK